LKCFRYGQYNRKTILPPPRLPKTVVKIVTVRGLNGNAPETGLASFGGLKFSVGATCPYPYSQPVL